MVDIQSDILVRIFGYLDGIGLCHVQGACKTWKQHVREDHWKALVIRYYQQLASNEGTVNVPAEHSLLTWVKRLPLSRLRQCLQQINTSSCVEKLEFQRLLTTRLFFRHRAFPRSSESITLPSWTNGMGEYKLSYFFAIRDRKRDRILLSELCLCQWAFRFKSPLHTESYDLKFFEDFTMISAFHNGERLQWEFLDYVDVVGATSLRVEQFPALSVSRNVLGAWSMENMNVIITQVGTIPPELLPVV